MRLIDADALVKNYLELPRSEFQIVNKCIEDEKILGMIQNAESIIPENAQPLIDALIAILPKITDSIMNNVPKLMGNKWIPVTTRPMNEEEENAICDDLGIQRQELEAWEKKVFTCPLPDDGQEILISTKWGVIIDKCEWDDGYCGLEEYGDWDGVEAWQPLPERYVGGGDNVH